MKKFLKVLLVFVLLGASVGGYIYWKSGVTRGLANRFVQHLSRSELAPAYAMFHKNLKQKMSYAQFTTLVHDGHLDTVSLVSWTGIAWKNGVTTFTGDATSSLGTSLKARVKITAIENDGVPGVLGFTFGKDDDD